MEESKNKSVSCGDLLDHSKKLLELSERNLEESKKLQELLKSYKLKKD
jgi:hypothetical protein